MRSENRRAAGPAGRMAPPRRRSWGAFDALTEPETGGRAGYELVDPEFDAVELTDLLRDLAAAGAGESSRW